MTQQINLLEPSLLPRRDWFNGANIIGGLAVAGALLAGHWVFESAAMGRVMASAQPGTPAVDAGAQVPLDQMDRELAEGQDRLTRGETLMQAVAGLTDLPTDTAARLRWLVGALPETAWLQEVDFVGKSGVRVVGGALKAEALVGFSQRLGGHPAFRGAPIQAFLLDVREAEVDKQQPGGAPERSTPQGDTPPRYGFVVSTVTAASPNKEAAP